MKSKKRLLTTIIISSSVVLIYLLNIITAFKYFDVAAYGYTIFFGSLIIFTVWTIGDIIEYKNYNKNKQIRNEMINEIEKMHININKLKETVN